MNTISIPHISQRLRERARPRAVRRAGDRRVWLETMAITLAVLMLGAALHRNNVPLQVQEAFPWAWLGPLLIALRYGLMPGLASTLVFVIVWELQNYHNGVPFPAEYFFGGGVMVAVGAEFAASWDTRVRRAEETARHLNERLRTITRRHLLLKHSHDRMEQEWLTHPASLRGALKELRELTAARTGSFMADADMLLQLLAQYCQLDSAAIFLPGAEPGAYLRAAEIGSPPDLAPDDPLLAHALEHQALSHLLTEAPPMATHASPFLVVAPILASNGTAVGILAVERMPFLALNEENLQMLAVLLDYYADCKVESDDVRKFRTRFADAPANVATEFSRMLRLQRDHGINSQLVVLSFANDESGRQAVARHMRGMRSLDVAWRIDAGSRLLLANLMPLAEDAAVHAYLARVESGDDEQQGNRQGAYSCAPAVVSLAEPDPWEALDRPIREQAPC